MTLVELALTIALLGALGLVARRIGLSAIPAYLLAGLLLGPNEPRELSLIKPSEVTEFVAELGLVFLLFFLGLEFSLGRLTRTGRHVGLGGITDLGINLGLGLVVGLAAFGPTTAGFILAACIYVSSSAIAVKGLIDLIPADAGRPSLQHSKRERMGTGGGSDTWYMVRTTHDISSALRASGAASESSQRPAQLARGGARPATLPRNTNIVVVLVEKDKQVTISYKKQKRG